MLTLKKTGGDRFTVT